MDADRRGDRSDRTRLPAGARFARENVALYIESVYDGHFDLAQIDKHLTDGYRQLGGAGGVREALTQAEVDALGDAYSEASVRLHPHVGVRLGRRGSGRRVTQQAKRRRSDRSARGRPRWDLAVRPDGTVASAQARKHAAPSEVLKFAAARSSTEPLEGTT